MIRTGTNTPATIFPVLLLPVLGGWLGFGVGGDVGGAVSPTRLNSESISVSVDCQRTCILAHQITPAVSVAIVFADNVEVMVCELMVDVHDVR